jgi:hypothetical protein
MASETIASLADMRAAVASMPRDMQRHVRLLWSQGHMDSATALAEQWLRALAFGGRTDGE